MSDIPLFGASVKAVIPWEGQVLLLTYTDPYRPECHYNLPGGRIKEGESLRDGVRRKVLLETGLRVEPGPLLFVVEYLPELYGGRFGKVQKFQFNFLASPLDDDPIVTMPDPPDPHHVGFEWVSPDALLQLDVLPRVGRHVVVALTNSHRDALVAWEQ